MTQPRRSKSPATAEGITRCAWCGVVFVPARGPGRPPRYCRRSHRQRAYEARRLAESRRLAPGEALISRDDLQHMRDRLYQLEAALQDAEADLAAGSELDEVHAAVVAVARRVALTSIEPIAVHGPDHPR